MPKVSIIIVGQNVRNFLETCLDSVFSQTFRDFEVIFVDNNSSDGSKEFIKKNFPDISLIENRENLGFCKANNQGIKISKGEYVLTLNCDVILDKDFLFYFFKDIDGLYNRIGMASGKILRWDRKTIDSTGLILTRFLRFYDRGSGELDRGRYNRIERIFGPCAAAAIYKRDMLEEIKIGDEYFDEDFFFSVEDVDLALRAQKRSWRAIFIPDAVCYHLRHCRKYTKEFIQFFAFRNRYFLLIKNERLIFYFFLTLFLYDLPRLFYVIICNKQSWKAIGEIFELLPKMLKKRSLINITK